jgi:release factor glutamine methyltransferase
MAELGCGAGQIGLAAAALTGRRLVQVDASEAACRAARANAHAAGLADAVDVRHATFDDAFAPGELFALVLIDPPYVPSADVDDYPDDPPVAIDGGPSGLDVIDHALAVATRHLGEGGAVVLQVFGATQAARLIPPPALRKRAVRAFGPDRALVLLTGGGHP